MAIQKENWDDYSDGHFHKRTLGWTDEQYDRHIQELERDMERRMAGEDPVGACRGIWLTLRIIATILLFVLLLIDWTRHYSAGTWEVGFVQTSAAAALAWLGNSCDKFKDRLFLWAVGCIALTCIFFWTSP